MARKYPADEFDRLAEAGGPIGVHRAPRTWWSRLWPYLLVLALAGGAAYVVVNQMWAQDDPPADPDPIPTFTVDPTPTPTPSPSVTPSPSPSPEPVVAFDTDVSVLNAAGIGGLAGRQSEVLEDAGFTNVTPGNLSSNLPDVNTVYYEDAELEATAQAVADALGIDTVVNAPPPGGGVIEVVLRTDPSA